MLVYENNLVFFFSHALDFLTDLLKLRRKYEYSVNFQFVTYRLKVTKVSNNTITPNDNEKETMT